MRREDFDILQKGIIYLDNAATTQKPKQVLNALQKFYTHTNANIHRGSCKISHQATQQYEGARDAVASYINSKHDEIIFTRGATESFNLLAHSLKHLFTKKDEIILTELEHNSNILAWQQLAQQTGAKIQYAKVKDYEIDIQHLMGLINEKTSLVCLTLMSNVTGATPKIEDVVRKAHKHDAIVVADAAQAIAHCKIDVKELGVDALAASGHKMYAPTGIGLLYASSQLQKKMRVWQLGGGMIRSVSYDSFEPEEGPQRFEAGTPNIAGAIGLHAAMDYISTLGFEAIQHQEKNLKQHLIKQLSTIEGITFLTALHAFGPVVSFKIEGVHDHDIASFFSEKNICIRSGKHCADIFFEATGEESSLRVSFSFYNTIEEIDIFMQHLKSVLQTLKEE